MTLLAAGAALLTVEVVGILALILLLDGRARRAALVAGAGFLCGLALLALGLLVASLVGVTPRIGHGLALALALGVATTARRRARRRRAGGALGSRARGATPMANSPGPAARTTPVPPALAAVSPVSAGGSAFADAAAFGSRGRALFERLLALSLAALVATVTAVALAEPLAEWDVLAVAALKAKVLLAEPLLTTSFFHDLSRAYSHLDYPLLWPLAIAWIWRWCGGPELLAVKLLGPATLLATLAALYGLVRARASRTTALVFSTLLAGLPMVQAQAARLLVDLPVGAFTLLVLAGLYLWWAERDAAALRLAGLGGAGLLTAKAEGLAIFALAAVAMAVAIRADRAPRAWRALAWFPGLSLLLAAPWLVLRLGLPNVHNNSGAELTPERFLAQIDRLPRLPLDAPRYFLSFADWLLFWPLALGLLALCWPAWRRGARLGLVLAMHAPLAVYALVFVVSPRPLPELFDTGLSRLLVHLVPSEVFLLAEVTRVAGFLPWERAAVSPADRLAAPARDEPS